MQTLDLFHGKDSAEIDCTPLEPNQTGADRVQNHAETLARSGLRKRVFY